MIYEIQYLKIAKTYTYKLRRFLKILAVKSEPGGYNYIESILMLIPFYDSIIYNNCKDPTKYKS